MVLFTDGGSTKCDWVLLDTNGKLVLETQTLGLNPTVVPPEELKSRILYNPQLNEILENVTVLDFYGAGCGTTTPKNILKEVLKELFFHAEISIQEDLAAAVHSVTIEPGIVCILGTGSNSCYFDGAEIHSPIPSLGYSVMDEASGNYFGKQLLRDYFYQKMPNDILERFQKEFNLDADEIKVNLYKKSNPNAYLASFAQFIFTEKVEHPYFVQLIEKGIEEFIIARILTFNKAEEVPIHFIGSIAHFSSEIIETSLQQHGLQLGAIVQRPMDGLITYYREKIKEG